jgi:hypothetical protein
MSGPSLIWVAPRGPWRSCSSIVCKSSRHWVSVVAPARIAPGLRLDPQRGVSKPTQLWPGPSAPEPSTIPLCARGTALTIRAFACILGRHRAIPSKVEQARIRVEDPSRHRGVQNALTVFNAFLHCRPGPGINQPFVPVVNKHPLHAVLSKPARIFTEFTYQMRNS